MTETVLLGGFAHETNTFADSQTTRADFQERGEYIGEEIRKKKRGTNSTEGGAIAVAEGHDIDLKYAISASATPGGRVSADAYKFYTESLIEAAQDTDELDGVVLCLHGAMVPEGMDDGEGPLIESMREVVGPDTPIAATLDLHGNLTDQFLSLVDLPVAYETYPHVDMGETGRTAMHLLLQTLRNDLQPTVQVERPPLLPMGPLQNTRKGPMASVLDRARELETREDVLKINVFPGFHQADVPSMGFSIPVVTDDAPAVGTECARTLATELWERRNEFIGSYPSPSEAVEMASSLAADHTDDVDLPSWVDKGGNESGPVVLADLGDNPGGGGAADGTTVLRSQLEQELPDAGFALIRDPEVVAAAIESGVGSTLSLPLGGKTDDRHGQPITHTEWYVKTITDGEFSNTGPMGTGTENHLGRTVQLQGGPTDVRVIVTENRLQPLDAEIWRHIGIQPERLAVLAVKSTNHFRADYEPMASHVIPVNSPGLVAVDPRMFEYEQIDRPKFPLDDMADDDYPPWN